MSFYCTRMVPYIATPRAFIKEASTTIASFLQEDDTNIDWRTVKSFGAEWGKFNSFSPVEIEQIGKDYFDIVTGAMLHRDTVALDVGCGSGRWIKFVAPKVSYVEAIEPSMAVLSASKFLQPLNNMRITQASVENIPFADHSFDFVYSLGVLHHVPQTQSAILRCYEKLKPGGWFLLYLYYNLDNRSFLYKIIFKASDFLRNRISKLSNLTKRMLCDIIAMLVYWPLAKLSQLISIFSEQLAAAVPLSYYRKTSFHIMRNDSLDRFGTPLEKRFSKIEIENMLSSVGFSSIQFSQKPPYWHVVGQKK